MKLFTALVGVSATLVALAAPLTSAWKITTANATQPEEVLGPHQTFVKVWTVTGASPVGAIQLSAAGSVFIDFDGNLNGAAATEAPTAEPATPAPTVTATQAPTEAPATEAPISITTEAPAGSGSGDEDPLDAAVSFAAAEGDKVVAKVSLSGNCTKLLDEIEVVQHDDELKIRFKNTDFSGYGYILTEVVVGEKASLTKVSSSGSSGVYVSEGVFASSNSSAAEISVSGDGDIFVAAPNTDFSLASLSLKVSGSGNVQFNAASLAANESLWTKISGDATIAVVAKTIDVKDMINTKISGEGDVYIQADMVRAVELVSKISGDGDITVSTNGSCVSQDISISGQGNVATGSILSENTKLKMSGEGSVLVQTSGTFLVPHEIDGNVQYVGAPPQHITDGREPRTPRPTPPPHPHPKSQHGWYWGWWDDDSDDDSDDESEDEDDSRYLPNSVTAAPENTYKTYELRDVPKREPTFLVLSINRNRWGSDPHERAVISILGWDIDIGDGPLAAHTQRLAARVHKQHGPAGVAALGALVIAAVAGACVAVHKAVVRRRRRREYQPLLAVVTN